MVALALNSHFLHDRGSGQESSFNSNAIAGNPSNRETFTVSHTVYPDNNTFKLLDTFIVAFFDAHKNGNCIAGLDIGNIGVFGVSNALIKSLIL